LKVALKTINQTKPTYFFPEQIVFSVSTIGQLDFRTVLTVLYIFLFPNIYTWKINIG